MDATHENRTHAGVTQIFLTSKNKDEVSITTGVGDKYNSCMSEK